MVGQPGSGKSSYAQKAIKNEPNVVIVSRDEIRFSLVSEDEGYFSREEEVYDTFISHIRKHLKEGKSVIADATHLTPASRKKLLEAVGFENFDEAVAIYIKRDLETSLRQNEERKGTRSYVPREVIRRMHLSLVPPTVKERFNCIIEWDGYLNASTFYADTLIHTIIERK